MYLQILTVLREVVAAEDGPWDGAEQSQHRALAMKNARQLLSRLEPTPVKTARFTTYSLDGGVEITDIGLPQLCTDNADDDSLLTWARCANVGEREVFGETILERYL